jgi:hypothetical protein
MGSRTGCVCLLFKLWRVATTLTEIICGAQQAEAESRAEGEGPTSPPMPLPRSEEDDDSGEDESRTP